MSKEKIEIFEINENKEIYKFHSNQYIKIKTLGEGGCGKVFLVKQENSFNEKDSKYFALKINKRFKVIGNDD